MNSDNRKLVKQLAIEGRRLQENFEETLDSLSDEREALEEDAEDKREELEAEEEGLSELRGQLEEWNMNFQDLCSDLGVKL